MWAGNFGFRGEAGITPDEHVLSRPLGHPGRLAVVQAVEDLRDRSRDGIEDGDGTVVRLRADLHGTDQEFIGDRVIQNGTQAAD